LQCVRVGVSVPASGATVNVDDAGVCMLQCVAE